MTLNHEQAQSDFFELEDSINSRSFKTYDIYIIFRVLMLIARILLYK